MPMAPKKVAWNYFNTRELWIESNSLSSSGYKFP